MKLTCEQKLQYIKEYLYDELCCIDFNDKKYLNTHFGTENIVEIVLGIIEYPLSHNTVQDIYDHMSEKYFHILTDEQITEWENSQ